MCKEETFGSLHRPCGHFIVQYRNGIIHRCNSAACENSPQHPPTCRSRLCAKRGVFGEYTKIINVFHWYCDNCQQFYEDQERRGLLEGSAQGEVIKSHLRAKGKGREAAQKRMQGREDCDW